MTPFVSSTRTRMIGPQNHHHGVGLRTPHGQSGEVGLSLFRSTGQRRNGVYKCCLLACNIPYQPRYLHTKSCICVNTLFATVCRTYEKCLERGRSTEPAFGIDELLYSILWSFCSLTDPETRPKKHQFARKGMRDAGPDTKWHLQVLLTIGFRIAPKQPVVYKCPLPSHHDLAGTRATNARHLPSQRMSEALPLSFFHLAQRKRAGLPCAPTQGVNTTRGAAQHLRL